VIVVDASVLVTLLVYNDERGRKARAALAREVPWVAPEHWRVEVFNAVRGLVLGKDLPEPDGLVAVARLPRLGVLTVPLDGLLPRMWELRSALSGYDAAYVALAESREIGLVTGDARLARAAVRYCRVEHTP
jgi:predicted nucleic acid-binding protein